MSARADPSHGRSRLARGRAQARRGRSGPRQPVGRRRPHAHGAAGAERRARLSPTSPARAARFPPWRRFIPRRAGSSGRPAICSASSRPARPTTGAGSITAAGPCAIRSDGAQPHDGAPDAYAFLEAEGPGLHQIPVGPVHAGHYRARPLPLPRGRRGGRAARGAARLQAQGRRRPDARRRASSAPRVLAARVSGDFDGRLRRRLRPRRRGRARLRAAAARARSARRDGRARADRQPPRRRRRDLQRRGLRLDARPLRHPARTDLARRQGRLRPSADDGRGRSRRRRRRSRARGGGGDLCA